MSKLSEQLIDVNRYRNRSAWIWLPPITALILLVMLYRVNIDRELFLILNGAIGTSDSVLWANITILGDALILLVLALPWIRKKPELVWAMFCAGVIAFFVSHGLKEYFGTPRPPKVLEAGEFFLTGPAYKKRAFPSGHTSAIFTVAAVYILSIRNNRFNAIIFTLSGIIGFSRIAVGIHWPGDVLGGVIVGWLSGWLGLVISTRISWGISQIGQHVLSLILLTCAVILLFFYSTKYFQAELLHRAIASILLIVGLVEYLSILKAKS